MSRRDVARSALDCGARHEAPLSSERWAIEKPVDFVRLKRWGLRESGDDRRRVASMKAELRPRLVPHSRTLRVTVPSQQPHPAPNQAQPHDCIEALDLEKP